MAYLQEQNTYSSSVHGEAMIEIITPYPSSISEYTIPCLEDQQTSCSNDSPAPSASIHSFGLTLDWPNEEQSLLQVSGKENSPATELKVSLESYRESASGDLHLASRALERQESLYQRVISELETVQNRYITPIRPASRGANSSMSSIRRSITPSPPSSPRPASTIFGIRTSTTTNSCSDSVSEKVPSPTYSSVRSDRRTSSCFQPTPYSTISTILLHEETSSRSGSQAASEVSSMRSRCLSIPCNGSRSGSKASSVRMSPQNSAPLNENIPPYRPSLVSTESCTTLAPKRSRRSRLSEWCHKLANHFYPKKRISVAAEEAVPPVQGAIQSSVPRRTSHSMIMLARERQAPYVYIITVEFVPLEGPGLAKTTIIGTYATLRVARSSVLAALEELGGDFQEVPWGLHTDLETDKYSAYWFNMDFERHLLSRVYIHEQEIQGKRLTRIDLGFAELSESMDLVRTTF